MNDPQAIVDPTRRKIIDLLAAQTMNLRMLAEHFEISRPAISQQIRILEECRVIETRKEGRETFCTIRPTELKRIADWAERYKVLLETRIDSFEDYVNHMNPAGR